MVAILGQSHLDHHQFLFWSSFVSFAIIISISGFLNRLKYLRQFSLKDIAYSSFLGLLGTYIYYLFLYLGYAQANGIEVLVIQYTWPVLIVAFSIPLLKEKLTVNKGIAIGFGFLGVSIVLSRGQLNAIQVSNPQVLIFVAAGATCFALFSVLSKKLTQDPFCLITIYFASASIASLLSMLFLSNYALPRDNELIAVTVNGIFVNGISYLFWILALKHCQASYLAPLTFLTPVLSAIYLVLFFDETFHLSYGIGLLLIITAGIINSKSSTSDE